MTSSTVPRSGLLAETPDPGTASGRDLSVGYVLAACRRHLWLLAGVVVVVTAASAAIAYSLQPRFRADATLMIDTRVQQVSNLKSAVSTPFTTPDTAPVMRSEVQILTSPELAAKVISKLDLGAAPSFGNHPGALSGLMGALRGACARVVGSICAATPAPPPNAARQRDELVAKYLGRLSVFNDGRSFILSVSFQDPDPQLAAAVVNAHVELYLADQRAFKRRTSIIGVEWIDQQRERLGATLAAKQRELLALREGSGLIYAKGITIVAQQVGEINAQLVQARADLAQRQARLGGGRGAAAQSDVLSSQLIQNLRSQEAQARQALEEASDGHGPDFPSVRQARARVEEVQRRLASETQRILASNDGDVGVARKRVAELEQGLAAVRAELVAQDQAAARLTEMEQDVAGTRAVYQTLLERRQELEAQAGTEEPDARLISGASEPLAPFFPNKTMMVSLGLLLGTVAGTGLVFAVDRPRRGVQMPSQLEGLVGVRALSPVPRVKGRRSGQSLADAVLDQPKSEFAEAIRSLRGDVAALQRPPVSMLAVSSALPREGKTAVATALARSMVQSGLRVLLVDCDLRRHCVGSALGVRPGSKGLIAVLRDGCPLAEAVVTDSRTALDLLLVEQDCPRPQDLLGGPSFAATLAEARGAYDVVLLDTPPQGAVSDALIVAGCVDATIMAVRWNATSPVIVRWAVEAFNKRGFHPAGVFLNGVDYPSLTRKDPDIRAAYRSTRNYYART